MNAIPSDKNPVDGAKRTKNAIEDLRSEDREFLPAALEILETPPSPVKIAIAFGICGFTSVALVWAFVSELDVYARSHGRLVTETKPNVVQSLATGKVRAISVQNGSHVDKGAVLVTLDPIEAEADAAAYTSSWQSNLAEVSRRQIAIGAAQKVKLELGRSQSSPYEGLDQSNLTDLDAIPADIALREQENLRADLFRLGSRLLNFDQQIGQSEASKNKAEASIAADQEIIDAQQARLDVQDVALQKQVGTKLAYIDAQENLARGKSQLTSDQGQKAEAIAAIAQLRGQKLKLIDEFIADNQTQITDAARKADDAKQQMAKANAKLKQMTLYAPISGTVEGLSITSLDQVIISGQQAMTITPDGQDLGAEVYISNADFGFIREGQQATLKIDAYPFTEYGTVKGRVVRIASDALSEQDAERLQTKPTSLANSGNYSPAQGTTGQGENLVFPVTLSISGQTLDFRGRKLPLKPGMTVEVEIKTDSRRVIDYLISPIHKITSESMHER